MTKLSGSTTFGMRVVPGVAIGPSKFRSLRSLRHSTAVVVLALFSGLFTRALAESQPDQIADGPLKQLSLAQLGEVEVTTASKEPEEVWKTAAAVYVLTNEDIRRSGATSIPEALRLVPGVQVSRIDNDHWAVGIRGFADQFSKSMLVMVDGRSLYTPLFAGVYWALQDGIILEDVERIEVIRGPGGTIWVRTRSPE
jgi:iron complex outermembrane recepter protein